jgi:HK97 family phage prohead protease
MQLKTLPVQGKVTASAEGDGIVEALVATYDVDSSGDRIIPGAFAKSLADWAEKGQPIPFIWSHMHNDLDAYIGDVVEAKETDDGLWVKAQIDMEDDKARKAFKFIKGDRIKQYSFAYDVVDAGPDEEGDGETALKELRLYEVGPTLIGMNQNTRTLVTKADDGDTSEEDDTDSRPDVGEKAGRVLSAKNEGDLRRASELIAGVLTQLESSSTTASAKASDDEPATDKEPPEKGATAKEPTRTTPVSVLAAHLSLIELEGANDESA